MVVAVEVDGVEKDHWDQMVHIISQEMLTLVLVVVQEMLIMVQVSGILIVKEVDVEEVMMDVEVWKIPYGIGLLKKMVVLLKNQEVVIM